MTQRRALVSQKRFPEIDRDTGSQRVDMFIRWLLERDWSVTFLATEDDGEPRHAHRLRQLGIPTFVGCDEAEGIVAAGRFDLALLAFWEPASKLLPTLRAVSPDTRVVIDSIDVHFLRDARRVLVAEELLGDSFGTAIACELNAYRGADAVLTVSSNEARLLGEFLGPERIHEIPLAHSGRRSPAPFEDRNGIVFIGNFRHSPNGEAVEYLCRDVLPRLSPALLAENPVYVIGSRLGEDVAAHGGGLPNVKMVGWVPSVVPYLERARVCVVPLLHGAGVKGKVIESLLAGTPVVTTTIGAEGMDLRQGEHALIADTSQGLADGLAHLLTDRARWDRLADAGYELASATHAPERVAERFTEVIEGVVAAPLRSIAVTHDLADGTTGHKEAYRETKDAIAATLQSITPPGANVLVISRGDDALLDCDGRRAEHFPQAPDGRWAGYHPADSAEAIAHLATLREGGARYFVVPSSQFWWLHHYGELTEHLESAYRRIYSGEHLIVFDLAPEPRPPRRDGERAGRRERVLVLGTYDASSGAPPARLVEELHRTERYEVRQRWQPGGTTDFVGDGEADWILHVDAAAVLPTSFVDDFLEVVSALSGLGVERAQPAHMAGPDAGPPVTEQLRGVLGRELETTTPLPVTAVRSGAEREGPTALVDAVPIALAGPIGSGGDPLGYSNVRDVFIADGNGLRRGVQRTAGVADAPRISVLLATYERPALLAACLEGFCDQTLPPSDFEVVVVDDGSAGLETERVLTDFADRLPLTWARIDHSGRAAAKNLAVLLARGDLVLFFDDDDRPAPDLLDQHVRAHAQHPGTATAILGHTGWDPQLEISPLMHYLTEVDRLLFSYGAFEPGEVIDWQGFWEGRVSAKRSLHLRHGLHDQRLEYSIDVELAWRLRGHGLEVVYHPAARSVMSRPIDIDEFCRRYEAKGRAQAAIASLHDDPEIREYTKVEGASARWEAARPELSRLRARIPELEEVVVGGGNGAASALAELHGCYREVFFAHNAKGVADVLGDVAPIAGTPPPAAPVQGSPTTTPHANGSHAGDEAPALSVIVPVWSRTPELAEMAVRTIERVWEVARLSTEVIVIDNGSPVERPMPAEVHRFPENRGVATGWNTGIQLSRAPVVAVLNSDCVVEPGWDEALYEAATTGRRIAFPYTDHVDGEGFRQPDQAGTAGWCFTLTRELFAEIGLFDERFNPAYGEDTDYWHRAWELGIELSPVPDARVTHARRSSVREDDRADWLLLGHRYKYGWKHGVDPLRAPPYYNREIVEYHCTQPESSRASTT
jgi:GT2 family glycosyltransferase/glycosyltransferase involved in cell wall biosynthesis